MATNRYSWQPHGLYLHMGHAASGPSRLHSVHSLVNRNQVDPGLRKGSDWDFVVTIAQLL